MAKNRDLWKGKTTSSPASLQRACKSVCVTDSSGCHTEGKASIIVLMLKFFMALTLLPSPQQNPSVCLWWRGHLNHWIQAGMRPCVGCFYEILTQASGHEGEGISASWACKQTVLWGAFLISGSCRWASSHRAWCHNWVDGLFFTAKHVTGIGSSLNF